MNCRFIAAFSCVCLLPFLNSCENPPPLKQLCTNPICENFEHADAALQISNPDSMSVSTENAFSGEKALKIAAPGGGYNHNYLIYDLAGTGLQKAHYGRMMLWLSDSNSFGGDFSFIQTDGSASENSGAPAGTTVVSRGRLDGRHDHFFANYDTLGDADRNGTPDWYTDCWKHPPFSDEQPPEPKYLIPKNSWACVQWHFNADNNEMRFWLNGEDMSAIHITASGDGCLGHAQQDRWLAPTSYSQLKLGIEQYHSWAKSRQMFIDDIEVGEKSIECPAME